MNGVMLAAGDPLGGMLGKFGAAGVGVTVIAVFMIMASKQRMLYNPKRVKPWFDIMSMAVGIAGMSALANLTGSVWAIPANILTNLINTIGSIDITADLGMGALTCIIAVLLYLKDGVEQKQYILYGCFMAVLFPAAGGLWGIIETSLNGLIMSV